MTIDEAIAKYKEITNTDSNCPAHCNISCDKCVQESRQLAEWLEELKRRREYDGEIIGSGALNNDLAEVVVMTREERDELRKTMNEITVEPTESMNLEQIQAFVKGYELAYLNILDSIDKCYRNMKTD